jgi:uncharacterized protein
VVDVPLIKGLKPYGHNRPDLNAEMLTMLFEEYESIKLCDYEMQTHEQAAQAMGVSRPTFTRIYAIARKKVARCLVEGVQLSIEGGKVFFDSDWYQCRVCNCFFNNPRKDIPIVECGLCGSINFVVMEPDHDLEGFCDDRFDECICTECGYLSIHEQGNPCKNEICPHCEFPMRRQDIRNLK